MTVNGGAPQTFANRAAYDAFLASLPADHTATTNADLAPTAETPTFHTDANGDLYTTINGDRWYILDSEDDVENQLDSNVLARTITQFYLWIPKVIAKRAMLP
ncbi:MAG: hypothetical protein CUN55_19145, partial [Phototrophicales bacterium]